MNSTTQAAQIIAATAGRFFACEFILKSGKRRAMIARIGVRKGTTGAGLRYNPADYNLAVAWDAQHQGFRMINLETLLSLRCGGIQWKSAGVEASAVVENRAQVAEAAPSPTPEQELAALDARSEYLKMRMESADRGYSRRYASLNAQTLRHKLARIQERQIALRAQIPSRDEGLDRAA